MRWVPKNACPAQGAPQHRPLARRGAQNLRASLLKKTREWPFQGTGANDA